MRLFHLAQVLYINNDIVGCLSFLAYSIHEAINWHRESLNHFHCASVSYCISLILHCPFLSRPLSVYISQSHNTFFIWMMALGLHSSEQTGTLSTSRSDGVKLHSDQQLYATVSIETLKRMESIPGLCVGSKKGNCLLPFRRIVGIWCVLKRFSFMLKTLVQCSVFGTNNLTSYLHRNARRYQRQKGTNLSSFDPMRGIQSLLLT